MTEQFKIRAEHQWVEYARGEAVYIEDIKGLIYGFTTELGALRIFAKYNANGAVHNDKVRVGFSPNRQSWFVSLETSF